MTDIDLSQATDSEPDAAPLNAAPLSGLERAGVHLTWGIGALILAFLIVMLLQLFVRDGQFVGALQALRAMDTGQLDAGTLDSHSRALEAAATAQAGYREFWLDVVQLVLLNVLFPTLTALLGYIFGTSRAVPSE